MSSGTSGIDFDLLGYAAGLTNSPYLRDKVRRRDEEPERRRREAMEDEKMAMERARFADERELAPLEIAAKKREYGRNTALTDPNSPESAALRNQTKAGFTMMYEALSPKANRRGYLPPNAEGPVAPITDEENHFNKYIESLDGMSAADILSKRDLDLPLQFGRQIKHDKSNEDMANARLNMDRQNIGNDNALQWAQLGAKKAQDAKNDAMPGEMLIQKNNNKIDDQIADIDYSLDLIGQIQEIKPTADKGPNTGFIAGPINEAKEFVGLADDEFVKMKQLLSSLNNVVIKNLGGSSVTGTEWDRIKGQLATLRNDDKDFVNKVKTIAENFKRLRAFATSKYQRVGNGQTLNTSNIARTATKQEPLLTEGEKAAQSPMPQTATGDLTDKEKVQRALKALSDPAATPKQKAGALKFLKSKGL